MGSGHRWIFSALGIVLALGAAPSARADEGQANALFVEAVQAWQEAQDLAGTDPATHTRRVELLETVNGNLEEIIERHPDAGLAVRLIIGEAIGPLSLAVADEALGEARAAAEQQDEACFGRPTRNCLLDVLLRGEEGGQRPAIAVLMMEDGRPGDALGILDSDLAVAHFLDAAPAEMITPEVLTALAQRLREVGGGLYAAEAASHLARAAAELDPSAEITAEFLEEARSLVEDSRDSVRVEALTHLSAAERAMGDAAAARQHLQLAEQGLKDLDPIFAGDLVTLIAREHIAAGHSPAALDLVQDTVEPGHRATAILKVLPELLEAGVAEAAVEAGGDGILISAVGLLVKAGKRAEALALIETARPELQDRLRYEVAATQAEAGDVPGSMATLSSLSAEALAKDESAFPLAGAKIQIATAQWAAGDAVGARATLGEAVALLDRIADARERFYTLIRLAAAEAAWGDPDQVMLYANQALEIAPATDFYEPELFVWPALARAFASGGHAAAAVKAARQIEEERWRRVTLLSIAQALPPA